MYRYKRVFSIGTKAITTYNPNTHEVTNQWCYNEFVGIAPSPKASNEFIITMKKGRKTQQMTYSTEFRPEVLTRTLMFSPLFCEKPRNETDKRFDAAKFHWDEAKVKVLLVVRRYGVSQVDITGHTLTDYKYKDIEYMAKVADHPGAFVVAAGGFGRLQLGTGALVVSSIIDFFTFAVCPPYSETTEAEKFDMVLELISGLSSLYYIHTVHLHYMFSTHSSVLSIVLPVNIHTLPTLQSSWFIEGCCTHGSKKGLPLVVVSIMLIILSLRRSGKNSVQTLSGIKRNREITFCFANRTTYTYNLDNLLSSAS
ncbi:DnaJ homolog subfamily C member 13 [Geodia barretti]|uniref:DnaJ homolog subfamily C member 13 n=1 Tax=Geodia barretti TaxID=519541 RepID=A0AA35TDU8_GEOBA|nr:DnaJ homolog subfamily C member 13 [Geodia barretti]